MKILRKWLEFLKTDLWRIRLREIPRSKSILIHNLRMVVLSVRGFDEDKCMLRASALTFYSLLSIVPVIAMMFGIAKGFGFEKRVERELLDKFKGQEEVITKVIDFANNLLENASGGLIAGIGVALLFWAIIKVLGNIEGSFNHIWGIKKSRPWGRKFSDYLSFMLVSPILLVTAGSATVFITGRVAAVTERIELLGAVAPLIMFSLKILPYAAIWILFTFIYIFMPNTRVSLRSSVVAGVVAGTFFQIAQWAYIAFQVSAAKYGAIYGTFAALPLFLVWLQISWLIVLFGAEISFAHQNVDTYEFERDCHTASPYFRKLLSLAVTHMLVKDFCSGASPSDATQISHKLDIPIRLVRQILFDLTESGRLSEVKENGQKSTLYQPARDPDVLSIRYVLDALDSRGSMSIPVAASAEFESLGRSLSELGRLTDQSDANLLLKNI